MDYQQFLNEKIHQLRVVCQSWDYLGFSDANNWIEDNFKNDPEGMYYATKILLHTLYYSKKDLENLLKYGINEKIFGEIVKADLIKSGNIYIDSSHAEAHIYKLKQESFFIPLSDSGKPQESGNLIIADLVHKLDIPTANVDFLWKVTEEKLKGKKNLIFVDDCIGSGDQLRDFWNSAEVQSINEICKKFSIPIYYLALVGYDPNIQDLMFNGEVEGLRIRVCDMLTDKNRIFSSQNIVWDGEDEKEKAIKYFNKIETERGISLLGHGQLDFAIILNNRVPDWSLPIFWKEMTGWKYLIKRKNTI